MLFFQLPVSASQSVTLSWNPSANPNVAGYKIYSGNACRGYTCTNFAGFATNATLVGLVPGRKYFFAATTYDADGNESDFSVETSYTVPVPASQLALAPADDGQYSVALTGDPGSQYVIQATTNLLDWVDLHTNTPPFTYVDADAVGFTQRFYRAYYLAPAPVAGND